MTEVPKIVHERLRAAELANAAAGAAHPEADLLTAFAEQSLLPAERDGVLQHLSACGGCRELVAWALPPEAMASPVAAEAEAVRMPVTTKTERNWLTGLAWPTLRWAALAAGVVVAGSVLLLHRGNTPMAARESSQLAAHPPSITTPQIPVSSTAQAAAPTQSPTPLFSKSASTRGTRAKQSSNENPGILIADAKIDGKNNAEKKRDLFRTDKLSAESQALDSPSARSVMESVEVTGASIAPETKPSSAANLMARNEAPAIEKAKPAPPEIVGSQPVAMQQSGVGEQVQTSARASAPSSSAAMNYGYVLKKGVLAKQTVAPGFKLRIAAGLLQRSVDDGTNWQVGLHTDRLLLCYGMLDGDVWAGGQAGTLFHSTDGGVTWVPVLPTVKNQSLSADITSIKVQAKQVLVLTGNNESWTTADGGKIWEKK